MSHRLSKRLNLASLTLFLLSLSLMLLGTLRRPGLSYTWTHADNEHTLSTGTFGPILLSIHDPTHSNVPVFPRFGPQLNPHWTDVHPTRQSAHLSLYHLQWQARGTNNNSIVTISTLSLHTLYPLLFLLSLLPPTLSLTRLTYRHTRDTLRDPARRAQATYRFRASLAALSLLTAIALTIGGLTQSIEASTRLANYYFALHSRNSDLQCTFHFPTGPWIDAADTTALNTSRSRPPSQWSALGCSFTTDPTFIARIKPEHYAANPNHPPADSFRPLNGFRLLTPFWLPLPLLLAYPTRFLLITRRRHTLALRLSAGLCPVCAYDIRHSPTRCPECGTLPPTSPDKQSAPPHTTHPPDPSAATPRASHSADPS